MTDEFQDYSSGLQAPATNAFAVVPDDAVDLAETTRAVYVGVGGNVAVLMRDGNAVTFRNVYDGALLPIRVARILATGTTASDILGLV